MAAYSDIIICLFLALLSSGTCKNTTCDFRINKKIFTYLWASTDKPRLSRYLIDGHDSWSWTFSLYFEPKCFSEIIVNAMYPNREDQMIGRINTTECKKVQPRPDLECSYLYSTFSEWDINITKTAYTSLSRRILQVSVLPISVENALKPTDASDGEIWTKSLGTLPLIVLASQHDPQSVITSEPDATTKEETTLPVTNEQDLGTTAQGTCLVLLVIFGVFGFTGLMVVIAYKTMKWIRERQARKEEQATETTESQMFSIESASEIRFTDPSKFSTAKESGLKGESVSTFSGLLSLLGFGDKASSGNDVASTAVDDRSNLTRY